MEDIVKFLVIIVALGIGIARQFKKESGQEAAPLPPFGGTGTPVPDTARTPKKPRKAPPSPSASPQRRPAQPASRPASASPSVPPPAADTPPPADSEYAIRSAEEARRAIIWGEILHRKY